MAAGDVWDYIFGSYVNAARALPYINDGVIVIRRLNARGAGTKPRRLSRFREGERADRCTRSVLRTVTHCEIRPTVTASRTRSIKSDDTDVETTRLGCMYRAIVERCNLARQARRHYGMRSLTVGGFERFEEKNEKQKLRLQIKRRKRKVRKELQRLEFSVKFPLLSLRFLNIKISKFYNVRIQ